MSIDINRKIYNNFGGNSQHDNYLKFSDDGQSAFKYPLQQKWVNKEINCIGGNIDTGNIKLFINNVFYCITNGYNVTAVNPLNGEVIWTTNIPNGTSNGLYGLQCTSNGEYISVVVNYGNPDYENRVDILHAIDGSIINSIILNDLTLNSNTFITSYNDLFYAFWETTGYKTEVINAGLITIDPEKKISTDAINITNIKNVINSQYGSTNLWPTFCVNGEIILLTDQYNFFTAYNSSNFNELWSKSIPIGHVVSNSPAVCLNGKIIWDMNLDLWPVWDAVSGEEMYVFNFSQSGVAVLSPIAFNADRSILIGDNVNAYNISNSDPNNWNIIWNQTKSDYHQLHSPVIIDDSFIFVNDSQDIVIIDINNGNKLWECNSCAQASAGSNYGNVVTPGIDENNNAILIVVGPEDPDSNLYGYQ